MAAGAPYAVGMGGLSLQAVWESFWQAGAECDRAFSSYPDGAAVEPPLLLPGYRLIGFSLPFELDWPAVPAMLLAGGLSPWSAERGNDDPLVIAGGASVTMNPEPLAEVVDAFVLGEAEPVVTDVVRVLEEAFGRGAALDALAELPSVYVPARPMTSPLGRLVWDGVAHSPRTSLVLAPDAAVAGRLYHPVRYADPEVVLRAATAGMRHTRKVGLIGAALSAYPDLDALIEELVGLGAEVSLSSLRADRLTPRLLRALRSGGQTGVTIAPEAATEALRRAIGKPISEAHLEQALAAATDCGLREVKLYFMTHLPGEAPHDRQAIVEWVAERAAQFPRLRLAVTLSPFVPKPGTPFAAHSFPEEREVKQALRALSADLRRKTRATVRPGSAREAALQARLARGGREVGRALVAAAKEGGGHGALKRALRREAEG
jgi:radical SAM superfamily enzyme YgiQ (UPF0313 family)